MYISDTSLRNIGIKKTRSLNLGITIGRVQKINKDGSYVVKVDSEKDFRQKCYGLTLGGDFGDFEIDAFQIRKETRKSHGFRVRLRKNERVVLGFINGMDVYPVILGSLPNNAGERLMDSKDGGSGSDFQKIIDEFNKGEGFRHFSGSEWFFDEDGDFFLHHENKNKLTLDENISITHNNGNDILINSKITLNSNGSDIQPVSRKTDKIESNTTNETTFWIWLSGLMAVLAGANAPGSVGPAVTAYLGTNPTPQLLQGEIIEGSSVVEASS